MYKCFILFFDKMMEIYERFIMVVIKGENIWFIFYMCYSCMLFSIVFLFLYVYYILLFYLIVFWFERWVIDKEEIYIEIGFGKLLIKCWL